jgi:MoxR-like ATPase
MKKLVPDKKDCNYWLFNVYFKGGNEVWNYCRDNNCFAMQYEYNVQDSASVTKNLNVAREVKVGDYCIAYTGEKSIIGAGKVTRELFNETNENEFIFGDEPWAQRIGVDWELISDKPIVVNKFIKTFGIENQVKLSSYAINKITKKGYEFAKNLLTLDAGKGEYREAIKEKLENVNNDINYWWLNARPKIWSFDNIKIGEFIDYTSKNERGNKRRIYRNFEEVKSGDIVIGYESTPVKAIVAIGRISQEHDGERIWIEKLENLIEPVEYSYLSSVEELKNMEYFQNPQGSLFKLTKEEYEVIMDIIREDNPSMGNASSIGYTKEDFLNEVFIEESKYNSMTKLLKRKKNIILQGPPGVGKTFVAKRLAYSIMGEKDDSRIEMIQFHQSYSYEDFIMGYRPVENGFKLKYGVFYRFCKRAFNDPNRPYYFIIDEINRGNISKIFGELLMLIEADKRGEKYAVPLTYSESRFFVPENIHIIGTMNTADRSLAMIDYALRRRFCFIDMEPAFNELSFRRYMENRNSDLSDIVIDKIIKLNTTIENDISLGKGFCIGHSYFVSNEDQFTSEDYKDIVEYEIFPLLSEYWFDDSDKAIEWKTKLLE